MVDKPWEEGAIKFMLARFLLYPFTFTLKMVIYFLSKISGTSNCKITIRSFSQKRRVIKVRIGKPISVAEQNEYKQRALF
jgi:hypothetical protein